jgi:hypothetical protein
LLRVPGVATQVGRAVRAAEYDVDKARLCALVRTARQDVRNPLLLKELSNLVVVNEDSDSAISISIRGSIDELDEQSGNLTLRQYVSSSLQPPVAARLMWHEDPEDGNSFEVVCSDFSGLGSVHARCWRDVFEVDASSGRASSGSGPVLSQLCGKLEQVLQEHRMLEHTWWHFGVVVAWDNYRCELVDNLEGLSQNAKSGTSIFNNTRVDSVGQALFNHLPVTSLVGRVLCYLQFDFHGY